MPNIETLEIQAKDVRKDDLLVAQDVTEVRSGKSILGQPLQIEGVKLGEKIATIDTDCGQLRIAGDADVTVKRSVKTEEERKAEQDEWTLRRVRHQRDALRARVEKANEEFAEAVATGWLDRPIRYAADLTEAMTKLRLMELLIDRVEGDEPVTLDQAMEEARDFATRELASKVRGESASTSKGLNLANDIQAEVYADFIRHDGLWMI